MSEEIKRFEKLLITEKTCLLIIDVQERILPVIKDHQSITENILKLIKGFKIMGLPIYLTEQYPKGLGPTIDLITKELDDLNPIEKMSFSCSGANKLFTVLKNKKLLQIVVAGIEAHVCVQQTVLDLLANDFQVNVAADAISSRREKDYLLATDRMQIYGAEVSSTESVLFELLNVCGTEEFRAISKIVK
jgi:nicotinamidase-related amidase